VPPVRVIESAAHRQAVRQTTARAVAPVKGNFSMLDFNFGK